MFKTKQAQDELTSTTVFTPHENDEQNYNEEVNKISIDEIGDIFQHLDDHGVRDVDKKGNLNIVGQRHK